MTDRLKRAAQYGLTALQVREQNVLDYSLPPFAHQMWLCPNCNRLHENEPINLVTYRCICSWNGTRDELCREDMSCLTTT